tara:strand:+ start:3257 stop:4291 length:1035 start_codon:yes stop_codon:yes gene_type:complete
MSPKNLTVKNKTHSYLLNKLKNKKVLNIYKRFEEYLNIDENFIVAVSGGPDSLALTFLSKIYSIKKSLKPRYIIIDHKLRKNSTSEAEYVKKKLKKYLINIDILTWNGLKPKKNIQSVSRKKRYSLLNKKAKELQINNILLGHHKDDLFENFFIRLLRGSGLKGLVSLDRKTKNDTINLFRPLLNFSKKDLIFISNFVFGSYVKDPSNNDDKFKRIKIRNFLRQLEDQGLNRNKFFLTIKNLKISNETVKFYVNENLIENTVFFDKKKSVILKKCFFDHSQEVIFRSFTEIIKLIGKKYYPTRGKKIQNILKLINTKYQIKVTLGGCVIKKVNETVMVSKEQKK